MLPPNMRWYLLGSQKSIPDVVSRCMYEHGVMEHLAGTLPFSRFPKSSCDQRYRLGSRKSSPRDDMLGHKAPLSADIRPFVPYLTLPPPSPDTYEFHLY